MNRGRYLTIAQAAERYPLTEKGLRRLLDRRQVAFHKVGRRVYLAETDIEALFEAGRVEPKRTTPVRLNDRKKSRARVPVPGSATTDRPRPHRSGHGYLTGAV